MPKCDWCGKSRDNEHGQLVEVQGHWSFPKQRKWMCNECIERKGIKLED